MALIVEIPLLGLPQTLSVLLEGVTYNLRLSWNIPANCWTLDIADIDNNPLISGIAVVTGGDLLAQFPYVGPPGQLIVATDQPGIEPGWGTLGQNSHLYYVSSTG
jgi:hypothetical protein